MTSNFILFLVYSNIFTNPTVNPRSHESEPKPPKRNELKPRRESNPKFEQRFPLSAAFYPLSYREVEATKDKLAIINRWSSHDSHVTLNSENESYGHVTRHAERGGQKGSSPGGPETQRGPGFRIVKIECKATAYGRH